MKNRAFLSLILFSILLPACRKMTPEPSSSPLCFTVSASGMQTKTVTNKAMGPTYDTRESFRVYAAYSEGSFNVGNSSSYTAFWDDALACSYNSTYDAWSPETTYYWPRAGYMTFQAYSPADASPAPSFDWGNGFTFADFTIPATRNQYDLLYTDRIENLQCSQYTVTDEDAYDDETDLEFIYNGINLPFHHALSLVEVQAYSSLGSYSSVKYYIQSAKLYNVYKKGTFTSSDGVWNVDYSDTYKTSYTLLDLSTKPNPEDQWKVVPGSDETAQSIHPDVILMPLPQELNRTSDPDFSESVDAYLEIVYKNNTDNVPHTTKLPLTGNWERGKKYIYELVFSADIEFTASISSWDTDITYGSYLIVQ